jgi:hypothetical protein
MYSSTSNKDLPFCSFDVCRQRPRKHFESGGALTKRGTFVYDQNQTILSRSRAERKFLKIWSLYNVGNGLYSVFTTAKRAVLSRKRRRLFKKYFFRSLNGAFKPRKKDTFFTFKKVGGTCPHCPPPRFRGPCNCRASKFKTMKRQWTLQSVNWDSDIITLSGFIWEGSHLGIKLIIFRKRYLNIDTI